MGVKQFKKSTIMTKQQIYMLRLRLRTIREKIAHGIFRLALRFPTGCTPLAPVGGPKVIVITFIIVTCLAIALGLSSCNVTRTITTQSEAWQKGDTSVVIQTKTVESYDGSRKY